MSCRKAFACLAAGLFTVSVAAAGPGVANGPAHEGQAVMCDLPEPIRVRNTGGTDGAGLCVWASIEMGARYQNIPELVGVFEWMKTQPGGGWPERVDRVMKDRAPNVAYRQYVGPDLDFIREQLALGRVVCVTYGYGEFYGMQTIAHMVICVCMTDQWTAIIDNNDPGHVWWVDTPEFQKRFVHPGKEGWALSFLTPPPPPVPHN